MWNDNKLVAAIWIRIQLIELVFIELVARRLKIKKLDKQ